jgi:MFS family permease
MDSQTIYRRRWVILSVLIVGLLAIVIDNTVLNVALKTIAEPRGGLGASQSQLEWAINSYTLVFAGLLFTFGVIGDKVGRKRMLMIGLALFGVASLLSAYSRSPEQLIFARAAMGLGGAAVMPQTLSIISNVFEPAERPRAIGLWAMAVGIGVATGPVLGGILLDHFWWGSVFLINVPVTALGAIAAAILVPESRNAAAGKIDYVGVLLSIVGLILLVYGIVQGGDTASWVHLDVLGPIAGGLAVLAGFAWYETRIAHPSLDVRLFRDRRQETSMVKALIITVTVGLVMMTALSSVTLVATAQQTQTSSKSGTIASIQNGKNGKPEWILSGGWDLNNVNSGSPTFDTTFHMLMLNGTAPHKHTISDFKMSGSPTKSGMTTTYTGTATITMKGMTKSNVPITIKLMGPAMSLQIDPTMTMGHFGNTPIYGFVAK